MLKLIIGIPGSGKTTYSKMLNDGIVIHGDDISYNRFYNVKVNGIVGELAYSNIYKTFNIICERLDSELETYYIEGILPLYALKEKELHRYLHKIILCDVEVALKRLEDRTYQCTLSKNEILKLDKKIRELAKRFPQKVIDNN